MVDFFAGSELLSAVVLVAGLIVMAFAALCALGVSDQHMGYRDAMTCLAVAVAGALMLTVGAMGLNEAQDRETDRDYATYHQKLTDNCDKDTVFKFEQIARSFQGARDAPDGPRGAYQALWTGDCQVK